MRHRVQSAILKMIPILLLLVTAVGVFAFSAFGIDPPSGLTASATGASSISLSWNPVDGVATYHILRSGTPNADYVPIGSTGGTGYSDTGLSSGTTYYYMVGASGGNMGMTSATTNVTVTFNLQGGAMDYPAAVEVAYGGGVSSPSYPYRTGYRFAGWCTDAAGNSPYNFSGVVTSNITLYAKWTPEYTVTYYRNHDASDGVSVLGDFYLLYDPVELSPITSVGHTRANWYRAGYTFTGWSSTRYGETLASPVYVIGSNIALYAQYSENSYSVGFDLAGGEGAIASQTIGYEGRVTKPVDPVRDGYTFDGWYYGDKKWDFSADTMPDGSVTLTARWLEEQPFTVTFDFGDGKAEQQPVRSGTLIVPLDTPAREGYTFSGWLYNNAVWNFETDEMPERNITLQASWTRRSNDKPGNGVSLGNTDAGDGTDSFGDRIAVQTGNLFSDIAQGNIPLGDFGQKGYFSVLSLCMAVASFFLALAVGIRIFRKKKTNGYMRHMTSLIGCFAIIMAALTMISFFLLGDFAMPKLLVSDTTLLTGIIFSVHLTFAIIYFRKGSRKGEWADYSKEASALEKTVLR